MRMASLADAFVALPGGWGTLDELAEILTWRQLNLLVRPIAILNTNQFFNPLLNQMQHMAEMGFLRENYLEQLAVFDTPEKLLERLTLQTL